MLLAGDAASLVNPMTGEGIFYAVATGVLAGRAAAAALAAGRPGSAGSRLRAGARVLLGRHLRHTRAASSLVGSPPVVRAALRAAARDQRAFDDLVDIGLGHGLVTGPLLRGLLASVRPGGSSSGH